MLKITAFVSILLVGMLHASSASCDSCGTECAASCGTRRFRACCFNYLRKKRTHDETQQFWAHLQNEDSLVPVLVKVLKHQSWSIPLPTTEAEVADNFMDTLAHTIN